MDEQSIFLQALEQPTPEAQAEWLSRACGTDLELKARIEALLKCHREGNSFLERPPAAFRAARSDEVADKRLAAAFEAGLSPALSQDEAVAVGFSGHSVLKSLARTVDVPRVVLREPAAEGSGPIVRPKSPQMPDRPADSRYQLQGEIARGGMGAILKGRDTDLGRELAIKVLLDEHKDKPEMIQRFVEEAQIGGQLQHPGIAPVYELGQFPDQRPFFSMKLVKGETLAKLLQSRRDPAHDRGKFVGVFEQACQTMAYAHSRGVIHRDLKPANIMVGAFGEVQVMDWGLAKVLATGGIADEKKTRDASPARSIIQTLRSGVGSDSPATFKNLGSQTQMGSVMGTPAYMSPEQALGEIDNLDERADVFGLGAILCEILTGQPPYVGADADAIFRKASRGKLDDCRQRLDACGADAELIAIAKHCLEPEPADRPRDAGALAKRVSAYLESVDARLRETETQRAVQTERLEQQQRSASRLRRMLAGLAAVAMVAVATSIVAGRFWLAADVAQRKAENSEAAARKNEREAWKNALQAERAREATKQALDAVAAQKAVVDSQKTQLEESLSKAESAERSARAAAEQSRQLLYATDMQLASFLWRDDHSTASQLADLLAAQVPKPDGAESKPDLRGFEWHYYDNLLKHNSVVFEGHAAPVAAGAFVSDVRLVTLDEKGQIRHWDLRSRQEDVASRRDLPRGAVSQVWAVSRDARLAALAIEDKVHIFETSTGKERFSIDSINRPGRQLIFAPHGESLVVLDDKIRSVHTTTGETIAQFDHDFGYVCSVSLSADCQKLALVGHGNDWGGMFSTFRLDAAAKTVAPLVKDALSGGSKRASALTPDGRCLVIGFFGGDINVYDSMTGREISRHPYAHPGQVLSALAFSRDGALLASGDANGGIKVWRDVRFTPQTKPLFTFKGQQGAIRSLSFSPDRKSLVSTCSDHTVRVWDLEKPANPAVFLAPFKAPMNYIARFSADGELIAAPNADSRPPGSSVSVWDAATRRVVRELPLSVSGNGICVAFSPADPDLLAAAAAPSKGTSFVSLWSLTDGKELVRLPGGDNLPLNHANKIIAALAFSPDGKYLVAAFGARHFKNFGRTLSPMLVWDVAQRQLVTRLDKHAGYCTSLDFSKDGKLLASSSFDGTAILWSAESWQEVRTLRNPDSPPEGVAFSPDGKTLAMASYDGNLLWWDVASGNLLAKHKAHSTAARAVAFSPDGRTLASSGEDGTVRLWNALTRRELVQLDAGGVELGDVQTLAFSPDGTTLLAGGHRMAVWSAVSSDERLAQAQRSLDEAIEAGSQDAGLYAARGRILLAQGQNDGARADLEKSLQLKPTQPAAAALAELLLDVEQAEMVRDKAIEPLAPTSEAEPVRWRFTTEQPPEGWFQANFDDSGWAEGPAPFGRTYASVRTAWETPEIWLRRSFKGPATEAAKTLFLRINVDDTAEIFLNGQPLPTRDGETAWNITLGYVARTLSEASPALIASGTNTLAVRCRNSGGGPAFIDLGLYAASGDPLAAAKVVAAQAIADPWQKLAAAYYFRDEQSALEALLKWQPSAAAGIGDLYAAMGQWEQAVAEYDRAITPETNDARLFAVRAEAHEKLGQWESAVADWRNADRCLTDKKARVGNLSSHPLERCTWIHERLGQWDKKIEDCTDMLKPERFGDNLWWLLNRGVAYVQLRQFEQARADFDRALAVCPPTELGFYRSRRAFFLAIQGQWRQAAENVRESRQRGGPSEWWVLRDAASICAAAGEVDEYRHVATELLAATNKTANPEEAKWLLYVLVAMPETIAAENRERLTAAAERIVDPWWNRRLKAALLFRGGESQQAAELFDAHGGGPAFQFLAAMARHQLGHAQRAKQLFEQGNAWIAKQRAADPDCGSGVPRGAAWQEWALCLALRREAARKLLGPRLAELDALLGAEPENLQALVDRAQAYADAGLYDEALVDLDRLASLDADSPQVHALHGRVLVGLHRGDEALQHLNRAVDAGSNDAGVYADRGKVLLSQGQTDAARADLEKSLELAPNPHAAASLAELLLAAAEKSDFWTVLTPLELKSAGGATLTAQTDGSILASGANPDRDVYAITAKSDLEHIAGIRLETLVDRSLPRRGPGRYPGNGNFHLNELQVFSGGVPVDLMNITVAYDELGQSRNVIDGKIDSTVGWSNYQRSGENNVAVIATQCKRAAADELRFEMHFSRAQYGGQYNLGRFRLSVSGDAAAVAAEQARLAAMQHVDPWAKLVAAYIMAGESDRAADLLANPAGDNGATTWLQLELSLDGVLASLEARHAERYAAVLAGLASAAAAGGQIDQARNLYERLARLEPEHEPWKQRIEQLKPGVLAVWDFDAGLGQWDAAKQFKSQCELSVQQGVLTVRTSGGDPHFSTPVSAPAGDKALELRYRAAQSFMMELYWADEAGPFGESRVVRVSIPAATGEWGEIAIPFSTAGKLTALRLDPNTPGEHPLEIDSIVLRQLEPSN